MKKAWFGITALVFLFSFIGCSSLPLPSSPKQSLFILPLNLEKNFAGRDGWPFQLVTMQLTLTHEESGKKTPVVLTPELEYKAFVLEPGRYFLENMVTNMRSTEHPDQTWQDNHTWFSMYFYVEKNTVIINNRNIEMKKRPVRGGYDLGKSVAQREDRGRIARRLMKDDHWLAWQDFYLVNFPKN